MPAMSTFIFRMSENHIEKDCILENPLDASHLTNDKWEFVTHFFRYGNHSHTAEYNKANKKFIRVPDKKYRRICSEQILGT